MWRFGELEADTAARELRHRGAVVHLEPQAFDLLVCLIEHRDRVVSKLELFDGVWGHRFVSEANLTTRVKEVRRAVGDDGSRQHTIKNVRGRGYRFVAALHATPSGSSNGLVGRSDELAAVDAALDRARLVTLIGPGGVGKSSLARAVAHSAAPRWRDGVHLVELAALEDGAHVVPAVAHSLGVVLDGTRGEGAARSIAMLDALIVLNNCEHVAEETTAFVARLLGVPGGAVQILATSQVSLGVSGETILTVEPLAVGAARELFTVRARAARSSWEGVDDERLDRLVAALDRLPLTVEMAAARLGSMTFDDLERVMLEPQARWAVSHRSPARRHRSLESLASWSAALLEPSQRRLLTELSVFAGGVTATEAAAVVAPGEPVALVRLGLSELAERSLLAADVGGDEGETRYVMLSTVRSVAARWLDESGAAPEVRDRHATVVTAALREVDDLLRTPSEAEGRVRLARLVDEVRAAHRWAQRRQPERAAQMSGSLFLAAYSSLWNEPATWSAELLASEPGLSLPGAQLTAAGAAAHRGELVGAREQAAAVAEGGGRLRASALELVADVALYQGDLEAAASAARALSVLGRELGDRHVEAFGVVDAALARSYGGDPAGALVDLGASVGLDGLAPSDVAWLAYTQGEALGLDGDARAAAHAHRRAIDVGSAVGNQFVVSVARTSLADGHARAGRTHDALDVYADALGDFVRHGNLTHALTAVRNLLPLLESIGDHRSASVLAGAVSDDPRRASYGAEADRVDKALAAAEVRWGRSQVEAWLDEGRSYEQGFDRLAFEIVDQHRHA